MEKLQWEFVVKFVIKYIQQAKAAAVCASGKMPFAYRQVFQITVLNAVNWQAKSNVHWSFYDKPYKHIGYFEPIHIY